MADTKERSVRFSFATPLETTDDKEHQRPPPPPQARDGGTLSQPEQQAQTAVAPVVIKSALKSRNRIVATPPPTFVLCRSCGEKIPIADWPDHRDRLRKVQLADKVSWYHQQLIRLVGEFCMWVLRNVYFREVTVVGAEKIPRSGAVVFYGNHQNQFIDALMMNSHCGRPVRFIMAEKSFHAPIVGTFGRMFNSVPVVRPQDVAKSPGDGRLTRTEGVMIYGSGTQFTRTLASGDVVHWRVPDTSGTAPRSSGDNNNSGGGGGTDDAAAAASPVVAAEVTTRWRTCSAQVSRIMSDTQLEATVPVPAECALPYAGIVVATATTTVGADSGVGDGGDASSSSSVPFQFSRRIDHSEMYAQVYDTLQRHQCIGIFPEGGSHDHTSLQPLKAGVALFSLGAAERHIDVQVVPCGLTYFYGHKFRSRAYIEFGDPITPPPEVVQLFSTDKRAATGVFLAQLNEALRAVTINVPDWPTLNFLHAFRQLYQPPQCMLSARDYLRLTRRLGNLIAEHMGDADVVEFRAKVENYTDYCNALLVRDSQAATLKQLVSSGSAAAQLQLLFRRAFTLYLMAVILVPFAIVGLPMGCCIEYLSRKQTQKALSASKVKVVGADVKGSYKLMFGFVIVPLTFVLIGAAVWACTDVHTALVLLFCLPMAMYVSLLILQEAIMELRAALPLFMSIVSRHKQFRKLYEKREHLVRVAQSIVRTYDPQLDREMAAYARALATDEDEDLQPEPSLFSLRYNVRRRQATHAV